MCISAILIGSVATSDSSSKDARSLSAFKTVSIKLSSLAGASCSTPPILRCFGTSIDPPSAVHSPRIILNKLVFPVPFLPTIPTF